MLKDSLLTNFYCLFSFYSIYFIFTFIHDIVLFVFKAVLLYCAMSFSFLKDYLLRLKASLCSISIQITKKLYLSGTLGDRTFSTCGLKPIRTDEPLKLMIRNDMIHTWTKSHSTFFLSPQPNRRHQHNGSQDITLTFLLHPCSIVASSVY